MKIRQKGQAIVEFALIFPIFAFFCIAMINIGMIMVDYANLSNAASVAARETALAGATEIPNDVKTKITSLPLLNNLYELDTNSPKLSTSDGYTTVSIQAKLKKSDSKLKNILFPEAYTIKSAPFYVNSGT